MNNILYKDVDSYIDKAVSEAKDILSKLRTLIKETIPEAEENISYGVPFYKYYGNFVGFAVYNGYVNFGFGSDILTEREREELQKKGYTLGKGTMHIKFDQELPIEIIRKILIEKAKENEKLNS